MIPIRISFGILIRDTSRISTRFFLCVKNMSKEKNVTMR